ncbi:MAG: bifunctional phosphoribosyl-AMP cyclohydrolase/phosphoribosyl-ATP diphosphatase HisIE [Gemmatimonadales bacterium]|nr:bifunctional phosphoribosyl-AMP cyclohydrolase/phosphoribosyl-ATP diphosphatase HisIE [Gemmatimonadales bacterium]
MTHSSALDAVRFDTAGLVPVVAQDARTGDLLMLAWADRTALEATLATGDAHYWSRSRQALWKKGESSGNRQRVREVRLDCDADAVLYRVDQEGPACHTGHPSCFFRRIGSDGVLEEGDDQGGHLLTRLARMIADRHATRPSDSYTTTLFERGLPKMAQKVGEEGVETVIAALAESDERLASEAADLLFHLLVLLQARGVPLDAVLAELARRER